MISITDTPSWSNDGIPTLFEKFRPGHALAMDEPENLREKKLKPLTWQMLGKMSTFGLLTLGERGK